MVLMVVIEYTSVLIFVFVYVFHNNRNGIRWMMDDEWWMTTVAECNSHRLGLSTSTSPADDLDVTTTPTIRSCISSYKKELGKGNILALSTILDMLCIGGGGRAVEDTIEASDNDDYEVLSDLVEHSTLL